MRRYPHQFSGGQRQLLRTRAALNPKVIIADMVSTTWIFAWGAGADAAGRFASRYRLSYLFISHDMAVVGASATG